MGKTWRKKNKWYDDYNENATNHHDHRKSRKKDRYEYDGESDKDEYLGDVMGGFTKQSY